ncbi:phosphate regulon sensor histidine kinase PhoR [Catenovulum sp. SM1970]|uniref:phosphate regulon sensor histidine kinase PhoR n=1 Tax=Marinifaba aquimaris TaxID=2741323 RepID=UPI0015726748|nr:phosphate regulon sensor histidine kinase PhoR [Marinifaba aquimaris]NTS77645.1 phosphate regulon sensor histidine kinase PhoR [Marinifaba aquimaris]
MTRIEHYSKFITRLLMLALIALGLGYLFDQVILFLFIFSFLVLAWFTANIIRLHNWLWIRKTLYPPQSKGIWRGIFDGIYRIQKKNRSRRKELGGILKRFRDGAESIPDAVVVMQSHGQIAWSNKLAQHMLGVRWPEDAGVRIDNLIRYPRFTQAFEKNDFDEPLLIPAPNNPNRVIEIRVVPYSYHEYMLLGRDVTQLQQLDQMRKDFIANVSHELRTPLTVLQGYLEMMQDPDMQGFTSPKTLTTMGHQCDRMMNLVNQLLTLSRIEANNDNVYEVKVNVPQMLGMIEKEMEQLNFDRGHQLTFDIDADLVVYGLEDELRSAFTNLIKNAIRYTPDKGEIHVCWQRTSGGAHFLVQDNGEGIAPQHLTRLTERFYRVDKARSRDTGGSGLGLSIVKHVLNHHKSQLIVESQQEQGSCFSFTLPTDMVVK